MYDRSSIIQEFVDEITASVAVVRYDERGLLVVSACNEQFYQMTGGRQTGIRRLPLPFDTLVPTYVRYEFRRMLEQCFESRKPREFEQAYDLPDGTHWWRLSLKPFVHAVDGSTEPGVEILVTGLEITAKMQLMQELEISTSRFRSVVDAAYDAIITMDQQQSITLFNRAAENLFGYSAADIIGEPITLLLPERYRAGHAQYVHQFARSPVRSRQMSERNRIYGQRHDGSLLPLEIAISKINVGGLVEFTAIVRDISDHVQLMDLLQKQATTDELTGLPNRRDFIETVEPMLHAGESLCVFILDLDHFKHINDTYGHDIGDEVLRVLAKIVIGTEWGIAMFARWGGEEFVAVLRGADVDKGRTVAEKLRAMIDEQAFTHEWRLGKPVPFTVSIGVAHSQSGERDVEALVKRADEALYRAKETGRNRVETA